MQIRLKGKNVEISDALEEYTRKKANKINKFFHKPIEADITLSIERGKHIVDITIQVSGLLLRGEAKSDDMYHSIDAAIDKIERQIEKYKTKINKKIKNDDNYVIETNLQNDEEFQPHIVRSKKIPIKPMNVEEAVMQMDLLGHDFFVFSNAETEEVNVIYRRKDGNYALLEPET